jgi:glycosyltransferase involved in cell wall biosynthesis
VEACQQESVAERSRILIVSDSPPLAAGNQYLSVSGDVANRLEQRGHSVLRTLGQRNWFARLTARLYMIVRYRRDYDLASVDVFSGRAFALVEATCLALRCVRKPYFLTLHGGNLPVFARRWPKRVRRLLHSATIVNSPSAYLATQMRPYCRDIVIISNAVDLNRYEFRLREHVAPRLIWLRAFDEVYNPTLALRVVALLQNDVPDIQLSMFGPDRKSGVSSRCKTAAKELGVSDCVEFPGAVPKTDISRHINTGDIFINTTDIDNTPVTVLEAMACGLCVVSTNVGGIPFLLESEHDSLLVPPRDPEAMAAAVRRILSEPGLAARLSQNARKKVEQFDWSRVIEQWEECICKVYRRKRYG